MHKAAINQLSLFEKAKAIPARHISVAAYRGEAHLLKFLYLALALCVCGYLYFVGLSIMNVIANREATVASEELQSEVATLEQEYFELSQTVTAAAAPEHGLSQPLATSFVKRDAYYASNVTAESIR